MAYITVTNGTKFPVHGAIAWDGMQQWCFNSLQPGARAETDEFSLGWKDLIVVFGSPDNRFDPERNGRIDFGRLALQSVSALLSLGSAGLAGLGPAGAGVGRGATGGFAALQVPGNPNLWNLTPAPAGTGKYTVKNAPFVINPVTLTGLYVPYGNDFRVGGCEFNGYFNDQDEFSVTSVVPLSISGTNRTNSNQSSATGTVTQTAPVVIVEN